MSYRTIENKKHYGRLCDRKDILKSRRTICPDPWTQAFAEEDLTGLPVVLRSLVSSGDDPLEGRRMTNPFLNVDLY